MWVAKIKISSEGTLLGSISKKCGVDLTGYPISFSKKKNYILAFLAGTIFGEEKNKKKFISIFKKSERVLNLEGKNDFFIVLLKEPLIFETFYNPMIIHVEPVFISKGGYEIYHIASWKREEIMKFFELMEKLRKGELLKLREEKIENISITKILPELTDKQKKALQIAVENGYYEYPRKIELKKLAKIMGVSYSTYQAHLRKAEKKVIPFMFQRIQT